VEILELDADVGRMIGHCDSREVCHVGVALTAE